MFAPHRQELVVAQGPVNNEQPPPLEQVDRRMASESASHTKEQHDTQNAVAHRPLV